MAKINAIKGIIILNYKRAMGVDFGQVRMGIALSDPFRMISSPIMTYKTKSTEEDLKFFCNFIDENAVDTVVFGLPLNMDGTEGKTAQMVREFAGCLSKLKDVKIVFEDERLTSVEAEEILLEANVRREKRKELIDRISAQLILKQYLERR